MGSPPRGAISFEEPDCKKSRAQQNEPTRFGRGENRSFRPNQIEFIDTYRGCSVKKAAIESEVTIPAVTEIGATQFDSVQSLLADLV